MESIDELKKIDIKILTCYYFDDIMRVIDIDFNNILLDEKSYKHLSIYNILYKNFMSKNPLRIWFDKIDRFFKIDDGIKYLVLV